MPSSEIFIISAVLLVLSSPSIFSIYVEAYGQLPDLINNDTYFLDNGEEQIEDDSSELVIPEKGVFERIERNNTDAN